MLNEIYSWATSGWVWYPTIFFLGLASYEWVIYIASRMDKEGSAFQKWLIARGAETLSSAFSKPGFARKSIKPDRDITRVNIRLSLFGMPNIPHNFDSGEDINKTYASYLTLIAKGEFEHAKAFILSQTQLLLPPSDIAT